MEYYLIGGIVLLSLYGIYLYNNFISLRARSNASWSDIDVQLKRRHNLIPSLIEAVKGYTQHEKGTLDAVTKARNQAVSADDVHEHGIAEGILSGALGKIRMLAEAYPDLKANQNFIQLQDQLAEIEAAIQDARRYYNAVVRDLNTAVDSFPSLIVARAFDFVKRDYFEIDEAQKAVPKVSF